MSQTTQKPVAEQVSNYSEEISDRESILLVFELAGESCGIEANYVRSIVTMPPRITRIPNSPDYVAGVINLRGSIIPVLDCQIKANGRPTSREGEARVVVVEYEDVMFGIFVEAVREVHKIYDSQIDMPDASRTGPIDADYVTGIAKMDDGRLIVMLDLNSLFDIDELTSEEDN